MLIVSYDISDDKIRGKLSKFLSKFGYRLQYSVFQIRNSDRMLNNIVSEIEGKFSRHFSQSDSVIILILSKNCRQLKFGYAKNDDKDLLFVDWMIIVLAIYAILCSLTIVNLGLNNIMGRNFCKIQCLTQLFQVVLHKKEAYLGCLSKLSV